MRSIKLSTSKQSVGRGALYLAIASLFFMGSGYLINIYLGRTLGPSLYGTYGVLISLMTAVNVMQISGIPQAVSKFVAAKEDHADDVLVSGIQIQILSTILLCAAFFCLAPAVASLLKDTTLTNYLRAAAFIFPFYGLFSLYSGYYNGRHAFARQALLLGIYSVAKLILIICLVRLYSIYGAVTGFVVAPVIALLFGFRYPKKARSFPWRPLIYFAIPLIGFSALSTLQLSLDLFFVRRSIPGSETAGYYAAAQNIAVVTFFGMNALAQALFPQASRIMSLKDTAKMKKLITGSFHTTLLILLPISGMMFGSAPSLIRLLYGKAYLPALAPLRALLVGYIFVIIFTVLASILNGSGKGKTTLILSAVGVSTGSLGCILLIPKFGMLGAAFATGLGGICTAVGSAIATYMHCTYSLAPLRLFRVLSGALVAMVICLLAPQIDLLLPVWWLIASGAYLLWLVALREITPADLRLAIKLIPIKRKGVA